LRIWTFDYQMKLEGDDMKRLLLAAALLSVTGAANASLSWVELSTALRYETFDAPGITPDYSTSGAPLFSGPDSGATSTTVSLGYLSSSALGSATYTYLGEESGYHNNFKLTIAPFTQILESDGVGASATSVLSSTGALAFRFEGNTGSFAFNGGSWSPNTSIGLIGKNMTLFGNTYEYVIGYNDSGGNPTYLSDWDDMVIGVNFTPAIPEPEIYAMMGLGLGLMGFVARRRKQHAVVKSD
jgi:hypothetical protein